MWLAGGVYVALDPRTVRWTVEASYVSAKAWARSDRTLLNGLYWGKSAPSLSASENDRSKMEGTPPTGVRAFLTDIVGERKVTVKAVTTIGGQTYEATTEVHFGPGPLAAFAGPPHGASTWREAVKACGGTWDVDMSGYYQPQTRLPTEEQLYAVAAVHGTARPMRRDGGMTHTAPAFFFTGPARHAATATTKTSGSSPCTTALWSGTITS